MALSSPFSANESLLYKVNVNFKVNLKVDVHSFKVKLLWQTEIQLIQDKQTDITSFMTLNQDRARQFFEKYVTWKGTAIDALQQCSFCISRISGLFHTPEYFRTQWASLQLMLQDESYGPWKDVNKDEIICLPRGCLWKQGQANFPYVFWSYLINRHGRIIILQHVA